MDKLWAPDKHNLIPSDELFSNDMATARLNLERIVALGKLRD